MLSFSLSGVEATSTAAHSANVVAVRKDNDLVAQALNFSRAFFVVLLVPANLVDEVIDTLLVYLAGLAEVFQASQCGMHVQHEGL